MKPRIYIETSVVSYLTARPARDVTLASHQALTRDLWDRLAEFDAYISELVIMEASAGDAQAASARLTAIESLEELCIDDTVHEIAAALVHGKAIPASNPEDALHLAVAARHGMDVVVTWNFRHLNNPFTRMMARQIIENVGCTCPEMCSPEELLKGGDI